MLLEPKAVWKKGGRQEVECPSQRSKSRCSRALQPQEGRHWGMGGGGGGVLCKPGHAVLLAAAPGWGWGGGGDSIYSNCPCLGKLNSKQASLSN
jgi:hypothetical protein